jgi:hypothetical protein
MGDKKLATGKPSATSEGGLRASRGVRLRFIVWGAVGLWLAGGCAEQNGVLEIDSGPPISRLGGFGAGAPTYAVHVGENLTMRFRSKVGTCDYAVMLDESKQRYVDCGPCISKQFEWKYAFGESGPTARPMHLTVSGYVQRGARDRMPMAGEMVDAERPNDDWDCKLAQATILVQVYQSVVEIAVSMPKGRPDWTLTKLTLTRADGQLTRVSLQTAAGEPGYGVSGPDEAGVWHVRYEPKASDVDHSGETSASLQVADELGQITVFQQTFATP